MKKISSSFFNFFSLFSLLTLPVSADVSKDYIYFEKNKTYVQEVRNNSLDSIISDNKNNSLVKNDSHYFQVSLDHEPDTITTQSDDLRDALRSNYFRFHIENKIDLFKRLKNVKAGLNFVGSGSISKSDTKLGVIGYGANLKINTKNTFFDKIYLSANQLNYPSLPKLAEAYAAEEEKDVGNSENDTLGLKEEFKRMPKTLYLSSDIGIIDFDFIKSQDRLQNTTSSESNLGNIKFVENKTKSQYDHYNSTNLNIDLSDLKVLKFINYCNQNLLVHSRDIIDKTSVIGGLVDVEKRTYNLHTDNSSHYFSLGFNSRIKEVGLILDKFNLKYQEIIPDEEVVDAKLNINHMGGLISLDYLNKNNYNGDVTLFTSQNSITKFSNYGFGLRNRFNFLKSNHFIMDFLFSMNVGENVSKYLDVPQNKNSLFIGYSRDPKITSEFSKTMKDYFDVISFYPIEKKDSFEIEMSKVRKNIFDLDAFRIKNNISNLKGISVILQNNYTGSERKTLGVISYGFNKLPVGIISSTYYEKENDFFGSELEVNTRYQFGKNKTREVVFSGSGHFKGKAKLDRSYWVPGGSVNIGVKI